MNANERESGGTLRPQEDEPVDLPVGRDLEIQVQVVEQPAAGKQGPATAPKPLEELARALEDAGPNPEWPADGAAQHDHYLYGLPKTE